VRSLIERIFCDSDKKVTFLFDTGSAADNNISSLTELTQTEKEE